MQDLLITKFGGFQNRPVYEVKHMSRDSLDDQRLKRIEDEIAILKEKTQATQLKDRLNRLDAHVRFEFDLTAQRLTYLAISESFLFSAYTIIQANNKNVVGDANTYVQRIAAVLPFLGSFLALAALLAVIGAISMTRILKDERASIDDQSAGLGVNQRINTRCWQHGFGLVPPLVLPVVFLIGWLYICIR